MKDWLKTLLYKKLNVSFSRAGDDIQLMKLINDSRPGAYVDVGCWQPVKASNTYYFYLRGWKGICIDPNPDMAGLYRKIRPDDIFVNSGVGKTGGSLDYYMFNESSMNTFSTEFIEKNDLKTQIVKTIQVPLEPLSDILGRTLSADDRLDFFDIDVEGLDLEVLQTNDWNRFRPRIVVIETDKPIANDLDSEIVHYLQSQNYRLLGKSIINGDLGNLFLISCKS